MNILNSRDIRDFPSPGQYDRAGPAPGQLPAYKTLVPAVPARGSKICARLPPGSRVHGIESRNPVPAGTGTSRADTPGPAQTSGIYLQLKNSLLSVYFLQLAKVCWWYYFSKLVEFFDTVSTPMKLKAGMHNCPSLHVWLLNHFTNIL